MSDETYLVAVRVLFMVGFAITFLVWISYTILAPWYKQAAGRYIWGLLFAILMVLSISAVRIVFGEFPFRKELAFISIGLFFISIGAVGIGIYRAQFRRYRYTKLRKEHDNYSG